MDGRGRGFFDDDFPFHDGRHGGNRSRHGGYNEWHGNEDPMGSVFRDAFGGHMFREMEEMMRNFGNMFNMIDRHFGNDPFFGPNDPFFGPNEGPFRHPGMRRPHQREDDEDWKGPIIEELPPEGNLAIEAPRNPRDEVLKKQPPQTERRDVDLDEQYRSHSQRRGLFNFFQPDDGTSIFQDVEVMPRSGEPSFKSSGNSYSFSSIRLPNGKVEEHRTYVDSQGNEHRIYRKTVGDKTFERIIKRDGKTGQEEETRNLVNLEEDQVNRFLEGKRLDDKHSTSRRDILIDCERPSAGSSNDRSSGGWLGKLKSIFSGKN